MRRRGSLTPQNAGVGRGWKHGRTTGNQHWLCFTRGWRAGDERDKMWSERAGRKRQS